MGLWQKEIQSTETASHASVFVSFVDVCACVVIFANFVTKNQQ